MLHYRASAGEARLLQAELNHVRADSVALIQADLLDIAKLPSLVEQTLATFGRLDALVNNASSFFPTPIGEITVERLERPHRHQPEGAAVPRAGGGARAAGRRRARSSTSPTSTPSGRCKNYVVYSVAKAGLAGLTRSLARELAPEVRVNAVAPGPILWPEDDAFDELSRQRIISHTPLKREGTPEDIARPSTSCWPTPPTSPARRINVDGGRHVAI